MRSTIIGSQRQLSRALRTATGIAVLAGCGSDAPDLPIEPPVGDGGNMKLVSVEFTQAIQNATGTLPMVSGQAMAVNVQVSRSKENTTAVPVVLRLYRDGTLIRIDTTRTGGVLGPTLTPTAPTAQFLVPGIDVQGALTWQVELDPGRTVGDSSRFDNLLPGVRPAALVVTPVLPITIRFVPIALGAHGNTTGAINNGNVERFVQTIRQTMPVGAIATDIAPALTTMANFGTAPTGGGPAFWTGVLQELDVARIASPQRSAYWYGVVAPPAGYTRFTNGGWGYIPSSPTDAGGGTRSAVGLDAAALSSAAFASKTLAHELGHLLGRLHSPSCSAGSPLDTAFPDAQGTIATPGFDVWSWSSGLTTRALSVSAATGDVMGYCAQVWASAYTWNAVMRWRQQSQPVTADVRPEPAIIVAGSVAADGSVTLRPALDVDAIVPLDDAGGDLTVELRGEGDAMLARQVVRSRPVDHADGERHFMAVLPARAAAAAASIVATSTTGRSAMVRTATGDVTVQVRPVTGNRTEIVAPSGRAMLVRDARTGDVVAIGWNGRAMVPATTAVTVRVSNGGRSRAQLILPR
jgi:hypothetical protein